MNKEDALFIAVAWIVKPAFRLFKLCPEVVWLDVTSHSNNKGFHLLTFSSRLSIGKQIVWMWIFIPNQQRFSFRWVFQEAIPTLLPKWLRDHVLFFMKDGDPQQRNEILFSFMNQFVKVELRCPEYVGVDGSEFAIDLLECWVPIVFVFTNKSTPSNDLWDGGSTTEGALSLPSCCCISRR